MKKLWALFGIVTIGSFAVLGWIGVEIYRNKPPIPVEIVDTAGTQVFENGDVAAGQNVWQALGGMQVGSIWGHGAYVAPDWTADWLHRESVGVLDRWARSEGSDAYSLLPKERQAALRERLQSQYRANRYIADGERLIVSPERAAAIRENTSHYTDIFMRGRSAYAIPAGTVESSVKARQLSAFFFWSSCGTSAGNPSVLYE